MICKRCLRQVSLECPESVLLSSASDVGAALALLPPSAQGLLSSLLANSPAGELVLQEQALKLGLHHSLKGCHSQGVLHDQKGTSNDPLLEDSAHSSSTHAMASRQSTAPESTVGHCSTHIAGRLQQMRLHKAHMQILVGKENLDRHQASAACGLEVQHIDEALKTAKKNVQNKEQQENVFSPAVGHKVACPRIFTDMTNMHASTVHE